MLMNWQKIEKNKTGDVTMQKHKHDGVFKNRVTGELKVHLISVQHLSSEAVNAHNSCLRYDEKNKYWQGHNLRPDEKNKYLPGEKQSNKTALNQNEKQTLKQVLIQKDKTIECVIDKDGFIIVDLAQLNTSGIRLMFDRKEGRTIKHVALEIKK